MFFLAFTFVVRKCKEPYGTARQDKEASLALHLPS